MGCASLMPCISVVQICIRCYLSHTWAFELRLGCTCRIFLYTLNRTDQLQAAAHDRLSASLFVCTYCGDDHPIQAVTRGPLWHVPCDHQVPKYFARQRVPLLQEITMVMCCPATHRRAPMSRFCWRASIYEVLLDYQIDTSV